MASTTDGSSAAELLVHRFLSTSKSETPAGSETTKKLEEFMTTDDELKLWVLVEDNMTNMVQELLNTSYPAIESNTCSKIANLLVGEEKDDLHGAVLLAVDANVPHLVSILLRRVKAKKWNETSRSNKFRLQHVSPLMLACHNNHFDVVAVLLSRDHKLPVPHNIKCMCDECVEWRNKDSLNRSTYITDLSKAICSPAFLWLACPDPLAAAAKMAYEMEKQANDNPEFQVVLSGYSDQCRSFCGEIAGMLEASAEIDIIIKRMEPMQLVNISKYPGLDLAISCHIKNFIVDPGVNAHLKSMWEGSKGAGDRKRNWRNLLVHIFYPITCPIYMMTSGKYFPTYRTPFYRFVSYTTSYAVFLLLLILMMQKNDSTIAGWPHEKWKVAGQFYTWLYVFGMVASDAETVSSATLSKFIEAWWHWLDFFALGIYLLSFYVWMRSELCSGHLEDVHRAHWPYWEPTLLFEASFSFATMLSFWRLFYYFQLSKSFGPLIISIGRCIKPIMIHITIIILETLAFSVAINSIYENYQGNFEVRPDGTIDKNPDLFTSVLWTARWMYWTFYGYLHPHDMRIVVGNAGGQVTRHILTSFVGELLIALYYAITLIILLNLLIAMMTGTAQTITENEDEEWMWERASIWHEFMQKHYTLPSPFNMVHIGNIKLSALLNRKNPKEKPSAYSKLEYEALMDELFLRYLDTQEKFKLDNKNK